MTAHPKKTVGFHGSEADLWRMWNDPGITIADMEKHFRCGRHCLRKKAREVGLPPRPQWGKSYGKGVTKHVERSNQQREHAARITPDKPKNRARNNCWPFRDRFEDDPRAAKWEPRWRESWAA